MYRVALQFANGQVLFLGLTVSLIAATLVLLTRRPALRSVCNVVAILGAALVVLSAAPLPLWVYALWLASLIAAGGCANPKAKAPLRLAWGSFVLLAASSLLLCAIEAPYHTTPRIAVPDGAKLYVIGDSLSIGADTQKQNWPELLGERLGLEVANYSFGGAEVGSALHNARRVEEGCALVILEIGGNDLLSRTDTDRFACDLDEMLRIVSGPDHEVVMFELPLPPFHNQYGRVQRRLAKSHDAALIPKRYLARILATPEATIDGLHFSHEGHRMMADMIGGMVSAKSAAN